MRICIIVAELISVREVEEFWVYPLDVQSDSQFFVDGRAGQDRWGHERHDRIVCGTGWGPEEYVCPLYADETCPGERNDKLRWMPWDFQTCDLCCGACGGGERDDTISVCGQHKGQFGLELALAEMGGTFRLDKKTAPAAPIPAPWPASYAPTVEWGGKEWLRHAEREIGLPMVFTTMKTAQAPIRRNSRFTPLRDRLGFTGQIGVTGLVKDGLLDDVWDRREATIEFCAESAVHTMVAPQFSFYDFDNPAMWHYNEARTAEWYRLCLEADCFPVVALDMPPYLTPTRYRDRLSYIHGNGVKCLAMSYQTMAGLDAGQIRFAQELNEELDDDVSFILFGCNQLKNIVIMAKALAGRNLTFSNVEPFAKSAFFRTLRGRAPVSFSRGPNGETDKALGKARTFTYNVEESLKIHDLALAKSGGPRSEGHGPGRAASARSGDAPARGQRRRPRPQRR